MNIGKYLIIIASCITLNAHGNTFTTDVHRRWGINSHIMRIPLFLKEKEEVVEKMVKNREDRTTKNKRRYVKKQIKQKQLLPKPVKHEPIRYVNHRESVEKIIKRKNHKKIKPIVQKSYTKTKHPLLRL